MEEICIKCHKPRSLRTDELIVRCPYCKDFFKPLAELIVLHEEELNRLLTHRPGRIFFENPNLKRVLFLLLMGLLLFPNLWVRFVSITALLLLLFLNRYMLRHKYSIRIAELERTIEELNREYFHLYPPDESDQ